MDKIRNELKAITALLVVIIILLGMIILQNGRIPFYSLMPDNGYADTWKSWTMPGECTLMLTSDGRGYVNFGEENYAVTWIQDKTNAIIFFEMNGSLQVFTATPRGSQALHNEIMFSNGDYEKSLMREGTL